MAIKQKPRLSFALDNGTDWMVIFLDGKKIFEHHPGDLELDWLLGQLGIDYTELKPPSRNWQMEHRRWPDTEEEYE